MDIYINPPREITTTQQEFLNFSYYELACFFINFKMAISESKNDGAIKMWTTDYDVYNVCHKNWRFKDCEWYEIESAELIYCKVKNEQLKQLLKTKFSHLFLK